MEFNGSFRKRSVILITVLTLSIVIASSDILYEKIEYIIKYAESIIYEYPLYGVFLFILLAMASAMLAFYSSAVLVPVGIYAWGSTECFILLWIGWILGGVLSFWIGYYFGKSFTINFIGAKYYTKIELYLKKQAKLIHILIFQAALPSEIPGYLLGSLHYRFTYYLLALAIVELPYAIGTIALGTSFLQRNSLALVIIGVGAILISFACYLLFRKYIFINHLHN